MNSHFEQCLEPGLRERVAISTRVSYRLATRIVAVSNAVRDELLDLGSPPGRLTVLNNPRPTLDTSPLPCEEARRRFAYTDSEVVILSLGHAVPVKGWDILLRAFARVALLDTRARLLLVGSTTADSERHFFKHLTTLVAALQLQDRVHFTGHLQDVKAPLAAADIFVLPSRSEGCSNALLEALEAGLPCVSSRVGNAAEVVQPGTNGFLVERNNLEELTETLLRVVQDDDLRTSLKGHAELPDHVLTRAQHADRMADLYEALLRHSIGSQGRHW